MYPYTREAIQYDIKSVSFIDILGFTKIVERSERDLDAMEQISNIIKIQDIFHEYANNKLEILQSMFF